MGLTEELDKYFSIFVRTRFADWKGDVLCYTCPARLPWKEMDCGHFIKRQHLMTRWEEDNCRPQCQNCNRHGDGQVETFDDELRDELGHIRVDELLALARQEAHYDTTWYERKIIHYKTIVAQYL